MKVETFDSILGPCSSNKQSFPVTVILPPFLVVFLNKEKLFFSSQRPPPPPTQTHTVTALPNAAFASSACRLHLPTWWSAFHQNNRLRPRGANNPSCFTHTGWTFPCSRILIFSLASTSLAISSAVGREQIPLSHFGGAGGAYTTHTYYHLLREGLLKHHVQEFNGFDKVKGEPVRKGVDGKSGERWVHQSVWCHIKLNK